LPEKGTLPGKSGYALEEAFPCCRFLPSAPGGFIDRLGPNPEGSGERATGTAQHLGPEVGDRLSSPAEGCTAAPPMKGRGRSPKRRTDVGDEAVKGEERDAGAGRRRQFPLEGLDEGRAAQDPLIAQVVLPAPPERGDGRPPAQASDEAAPLKFWAPAQWDAGGDESPVGGSGPARGAVEPGEHRRGRLPGLGLVAEEGRMAAPGIPVQFREASDHAGAEGVQVEVPDEFEKVGLRLDHHRLVPVLEEMARALMAPVEGTRVSGEEAAHAPAERPGPSPDEEVGVVREEGPGVDGEGPRRRERPEARDEIGPVPVVPEDPAAFQPTEHDVVEHARRIEAGTAWHGRGERSITCHTWQRPVCLPCVIEEFRAPFADRLVLGMMGRGLRLETGVHGFLRTRIRRLLARGFSRSWNKRVRWHGKMIAPAATLEHQAAALVKLFLGQGEYHPFHMRW